jgi:hypothetical protein
MPANATTTAALTPAQLTRRLTALIHGPYADTSTAASRLPQLLAELGDWLNAETAAGRIADDHRRPPDQHAARIRAALTHAAGTASTLTADLAHLHNLTATLHADGPATPPARTGSSA